MSNTKTARRTALLGAGLMALSIVAAPLAASAASAYDDSFADQQWKQQIHEGVVAPKYVPGSAVKTLGYVPVPEAHSVYDGQIWEAEMDRVQNGVQTPKYTPDRTQSKLPYVPVPEFNAVEGPGPQG